MKANRKFVNNDAGVGAVLGVVLMVAITVAIAGTVYYLVSDYEFYRKNIDYNIFIGKFESVKPFNMGYTYNFFYVIIGNHSLYLTEFEQEYFTDTNYLCQYLGYNVSITVKCLTYDFPEVPKYKLIDINIIN